MKELLLNDEPLDIKIGTDTIVVKKGNCLFKTYNSITKTNRDSTINSIVNKHYLAIGMSTEEGVEFERLFNKCKAPTDTINFAKRTISAVDVMYYDKSNRYTKFEISNILPSIKWPSRDGALSIDEVKRNKKRELFHTSIKTFTDNDYKTCMNNPNTAGLVPNETWDSALADLKAHLRYDYWIIIKIDEHEHI